MAIAWTTEEILALAPDANSAKNGQALATSRKWQGLGTNEEVVWGECQGSGSKPYQTQIDLIETAFKCSCPSRKFPCKHGLALLLLLVNQSDTFTQNQTPAWVTDWINSRRQKQAKKAESGKVVDPVAQAKRAAKREANVTAGVQELDYWLRDLVRQGVAILPGKDYSFWDTIAARMVDAQARLLARQLRQMSSIPHTGFSWQERLLVRLGRLHLLIEGFKRLETLAFPTQADILTRIDWEFDKQLSGEMNVRDRWLILGQHIEEIDGEKDLLEQRTWLWGSESKQAALILNSTHISQPPDQSLVPGTSLDAELVFYPSAYPLRAFIKVRHTPPTPFYEMPGDERIITAFTKYTKALACQPWLEQFPLILKAVIPQRYNNSWVLCDSTHHLLPLSPNFTQGWQLLALSGGHPLAVFGEWNGRDFLPLSSLTQTQFICF
ncbi:MAG TPA: hypothetical protein DCY91_08235 [Cyanobacteria bacterium UBA11370]|nr:hypothetical protein [Cyanobacteria bacterium UBA11370]HBY81359.1 hypothetical protein [Cyanobacteria bacterium UBA11148]